MATGVSADREGTRRAQKKTAQDPPAHNDATSNASDLSLDCNMTINSGRSPSYQLRDSDADIDLLSYENTSVASLADDAPMATVDTSQTAPVSPIRPDTKIATTPTRPPSKSSKSTVEVETVSPLEAKEDEARARGSDVPIPPPHSRPEEDPPRTAPTPPHQPDYTPPPASPPAKSTSVLDTISGTSTFGEVSISSQSLKWLADPTGWLDDTILRVLGYRAKHRLSKVPKKKGPPSAIGVWNPTVLESFLKDGDERVSSPKEIGLDLGLPNVSTQKASREASFSVRIIAFINDRFATDGKGGGTSNDGRHWSLVIYDVITDKGSTRMFNKCNHLDSLRTSSHDTIARSFCNAMRGILNAMYPQLVWGNGSKTSQVGTVSVPRQTDGNSCGVFAGEFAYLTAGCRVLSNAKSLAKACSHVTQRSIHEVRRRTLESVIHSITGAIMPTKTSLDQEFPMPREQSPPPPPPLDRRSPTVDAGRVNFAGDPPAPSTRTDGSAPPSTPSIRQGKYSKASGRRTAEATKEAAPMEVDEVDESSSTLSESTAGSSHNGSDDNANADPKDGLKARAPRRRHIRQKEGTQSEKTGATRSSPRTKPPPVFVGEKTYATLWVNVIPGVLQSARNYQGTKALLQAVHTVDPTALLHPLYDESTDPPLQVPDDVPADAILLGNYSQASNPNSLLEQKGTHEGSNKPKKNFPIYNTLWLSSKLDPQHICDRINVGLDDKDVQCRFAVKHVQSVDTAKRFGLINVHPHNCTYGLASVMSSVLADAEKKLARNYNADDTSKGMYPHDPDVDPIELHCVMNAFRDLALANRPVQVNLKRNFSWTKRGPQFEMSYSHWQRVKPLVKQIDDKGLFSTYFGRCVALIPLGRDAPRDELMKHSYQEDVRSHMTYSLLHLVHVLTGLTYPNKKFKVAYSDGRPPPRRSYSIAKVLLEIQLPDTPERNTVDWAFEAVIPICRGENAGSSYLTILDDRTNAFVKRGVKRKTDGPVTDLVRKLTGPLAAPWLLCYMTHQLKFTKGTCTSAMRSFDEYVRSDIDDLTWDPETWSLAFDHYSPPTSGHRQLQDRMERRGFDVSQIDFGTFVDDKEKVDKDISEEEAKARERIIAEERLYPDPSERRVGASGASARTGADDDDISKQPSANASEASENWRATRQKDKMKIIREKEKSEILAAALRAAGINPDDVFARQADEDAAMNVSDDEGSNAATANRSASTGKHNQHYARDFDSNARESSGGSSCGTSNPDYPHHGYMPGELNERSTMDKILDDHVDAIMDVCPAAKRDDFEEWILAQDPEPTAEEVYLEAAKLRASFHNGSDAEDVDAEMGNNETSPRRERTTPSGAAAQGTTNVK